MKKRNGINLKRVRERDKRNVGEKKEEKKGW